MKSRLTQAVNKSKQYINKFDKIVLRMPSESGFDPASAFLSPYAPLRRLNAICPYLTMFPLEFPYRQLLRAEPGEWVFDPFCGRGTTIYAARLLGLPSVGVDGNPVAAAVAEAKLVDVDADEIIRVCRAILSSPQQPAEVPSGKFWRLCYHSKTLENICKLRGSLARDCSTPARVALRALLLGVLHGPRNLGEPTYLSNQMPRTYATKPAAAVSYWERKRLRPKNVDVLDVVSRRALFTFKQLPPKTDGRVVFGDARSLNGELPRRKFRWVITSPPYYGMRTYVPDQWIRNWFLGGDSRVVYSNGSQLNHYPEAEFMIGLARVWKGVADRCSPGARLIVRFGALPCLRRDPGAILKRTLRESGSPWRILTIQDAGHATVGKRQADQFKRNAGRAVMEVDLHAVLEN